MRNDELLKQQLEQIATRRRKPKAVEQSKQTGQRYNTQLRQIVRQVRNDINKTIVPLLRQLAPEYQADGVVTLDQFAPQILAALESLKARWTSPQFDALARDIAGGFVRTASEVNKQRLQRNLGINIYQDAPSLIDYIELSIADNVDLIKSIPAQYLNQVGQIVKTNVRAGLRPSAMVKQISERFDVSEKRAKMIARDQTAKVNGDLTSRRQQAAGINYFQWMDSDDERVRSRHESLANKVTAYGKGVYRWDDPPLSDKGVPIIPGEDYQCRCTARPVFDEEVEANQKAGRVNPTVKR